MSEATHYWPRDDERGFYMLDHCDGKKRSWHWDGSLWEYMLTTASTSRLMELGYLGVRREPAVNTHKPPRNDLTPDPDDGNAMVAQDALNEWRACKQQPKAADWAYRWAVNLCERLGAR